MPEPKRPLKVFLCHASTDKPKVRDLYRYLRKRGIQPWFDEEHLVGGQDWQVEIPKALATSDAIIICLTKNSVDKEGYIQKEIKFALDKALEMPEGRIFLIPVKFEECEVPFSLSRYQWVDLTVESGYAKMMKALKFRASQLERNTVQLPKNEIDEDKLAIEKGSRERAEKEEVEKEDKRRLEKSIKKAKWDFWWAKLKIDIRHRFQVVYIYRVTILIFLVALAFVTPLLIRLSDLIPEIITTLNNTPTVAIGLTLAPQSTTNSTEAFVPLEILTPSPMPTEVLVVTPTLLPAEITDAKGVSMVLVSVGDFIMGSEGGESDEKPVHQVFLDSFYIDKYETTNLQYKSCVDLEVCSPPKKYESNMNLSYFGNPRFDNYPVIYVDWNMAKTFCEWRDAELPTEAQWEKAARGDDQRIYAWGDDFYGCSNANFGECNFNDPLNVESCLNKSPYGICDMSGNVWEWVMDWYSPQAYSELLGIPNPIWLAGGDEVGGDRVRRGGSWSDTSFSIRVTDRGGDNPIYGGNNVGFRCAKEAP